MSRAKQTEEVKKSKSSQSVIHAKSPSGHHIDSISKNKLCGNSRNEVKWQSYQSGSKLSKFDDKAKCRKCTP